MPLLQQSGKVGFWLGECTGLTDGLVHVELLLCAIPTFAGGFKEFQAEPRIKRNRRYCCSATCNIGEMAHVTLYNCSYASVMVMLLFVLSVTKECILLGTHKKDIDTR
jgi:hypothetical protein